jgi:acyl-CoA synthetase (AMP-forming)/AMP-acid ligase II
MTGYIGNPEATRKAFAEGWYLGLQDICFALRHPADGALDYYWLGRDSSLLIRGGANYAYDQINGELATFIARHYGLPKEQFEVAVVGLRVDSEHEDSCCVTLELQESVPAAMRSRIDATFLHDALGQVSKGARPDFLRVAPIPRNFKGAVLVPELRDAFRAYLGRGA